MDRLMVLILCCFVLSAGCDNTDYDLAAEAGFDVIKAVTLSDEAVKNMAVHASQASDARHTVASGENPYGKRLYRLEGSGYADRGYRFNFKVYLSGQVNAFAMADGSIRIYSGLMDMMTDDELLFVVGHEMGHVVKKHIKKKIMVAYAARAVRKGVASQESLAGDIARSVLGGLVQDLLNAQFSQEEERQADDYGLLYLKKRQKNPGAAVSALKKLAGLGKGHSFLSSHPAPDVRARRIQKQLDSPQQTGTPDSPAKLFDRIRQFISDTLTSIQEGTP